MSISAPSLLMANDTSHDPGDTSVDVMLTWRDNSTNETGFAIERSTDGTNYSTLTTASANAHAYEDTDAPSGHLYYRVRAVNDTEQSEYTAAADTQSWTSANIGSASGGSWSESGGTVTVVTNGQDFSSTSDAGGRLVYRSITGDATIVARVATVQNTNSLAKAGVMFRNSLANNSKNVFLAITPSGSAQWQRRLSDGASTDVSTVSGRSAPQWVKLVRAGSSFTSYLSTDGTSWTQVGQKNVAMGQTIYVGLALSSSGWGTSNTSTFTDVSVSAQDHNLPAHWSSQDIGSATFAGSARYYGEGESPEFTFAVEASGQNVGGYSDAFHFARRSFVGDGELITRVATVQTGYTYAKAGIMFREGMGADAKNVFLAISAANGAVWQNRSTVGGNTTETWSSGKSAPYYLKLKRVGNTFTGYTSSDGSTWSQIGSSVTISMNSSVEVGLALSAAGYGVLNTSTFDHVSFVPVAPILSATAVHGRRIDLSWTCDTGSADGYSLQRSADAGSTWSDVGEEIHASAFVDDTVDPDTDYQYRLKAVIDDDTGGSSTWSSAASASTDGLGDGLAATYWDHIDFSGDTYETTELEINKYWSSGQSPGGGLAGSHFVAEFKGQLKAPSTGSYTFNTNSDDGVRVWVNNQLVINHYNKHSPATNSGSINLTAGQKYDVRVVYFQLDGTGDLQLRWTTPGSTNLATVPTVSLYSTGGTFAAPSLPEDLHAQATQSVDIDTQPTIYTAWTQDAGVAFYDVYRKEQDGSLHLVGSKGASDASNLQDNNGGLYLDLDAAYVYSMVAMAPGGQSQALAFINAPTDVVATAADRVITVTWTDNTQGDVPHLIQRSSDNGATWSSVASCPAATTVWVDPNVEPNVTYTYAVMAGDGFAVSEGDSASAQAIEDTATDPVQAVFYASVDRSGPVALSTRYPTFRVDGAPSAALGRANISGKLWATLNVPTLGNYTLRLTTYGYGRVLLDDQPTGIEISQDMAMKPSDFNDNGIVDFFDLVKVAQNYEAIEGGAQFQDGDALTSHDGIVDFDDLVAVSQNYETAQAAQTQDVTLTNLAPGTHRVTLEYANVNGLSGWNLQWKKPGDSAFSDLTNTELDSPSRPAAASNLGMTIESSGDISLSWSDASGVADDFRVERQQGNGGAWLVLGSTGTNTSFVDTATMPGVLYNYRVKTVADGVEASAYTATSNTTSLTPSTGAPVPPPDVPAGGGGCCACGDGGLIETTGGVPTQVTTGGPSIGLVTQSIPLVSTRLMGFDLGVTLVWTNNPAYTDPVLGHGLSIAELPRVVVYNQGDSVAVVSGASARQFDQSGGTLVERQGGKDTLVYNYILRQYIFTDSTGQRFYINDHTDGPEGNRSDGMKGVLVKVVRPDDSVLTVERDSSGMPTSMEVDSDPTDAVDPTQVVIFGTSEDGLESVGVIDTMSGTDVASVAELGRYDPEDENEADDEFGNDGDLQSVQILTGGTRATLDEMFYRYFKTTDGSPSRLKSVLGSASAARAMANSVDPVSASDGAIAPYADKVIAYDAQGRKTSVKLQGGGCSACGGQGESTYQYTTSTNSIENNVWKTRTVEVQSDGNQTLHYFNGHGQEMLRVLQGLATPKAISTLTHSGTTATVSGSGHGYSTNDVVVIRGADQDPYNGIFAVTVVDANTFTYTMASDPGANAVLASDAAARKVQQQWGTFTQYDEVGRVVLQAQPSAVSLPANVTTLEQYTDLLHAQGDDYEFLRNTAGLIETTQYYTDTDATVNLPGGVSGFVKSQTALEGEKDATPSLLWTQRYLMHSYDGVTQYQVGQSTVSLDGSGTSNQQRITGTSNWSWAPYSNRKTGETHTRPGASSAHNGSWASETEQTIYDAYGNPAWSKDAAGFITYRHYDAAGHLLKEIVDVKYASLNGAEQAAYPSAWSTSVAGLHLVTTYEIDGLGRTTKVTDPNLIETYTVYKDADHEVRVYPGWHDNTTTGPIQITREDRAGSYSETLSLAAVPSVTNGRPNGAEAITAADIVSLSRTHTSDGGQTDYSDSYFAMPAAYTTGTNLGTEGTHFLRTRYGYEKMGRLAWTMGPDGTISHSFYNVQGQVITQWTGTDDVPSSDLNGDTYTDWRDFRYAVGADGTGTAPANTNMLKVSQSVYDAGGNLTQSRAIFGDGSTDYYATDYKYDFQNRLTDQRGPDNVAVHYTFNNAGDTTLVETYVDADSDFVIDVGELRGKTESFYDEQGRVYRTTSYADQASSLATHKLTSNTWYGTNGQVIKSQGPSGVFSKTAYDGAGRAVATYTGFDAVDTEIDDTYTGSAYSGAGNVVGDTILTQSKVIYDKGSRPIVSTSFARRENDTTTTGELSADNAFIQTGAAFYDQANRTVASVSFGRDNGATRYIFNSNGTIKDTDADGIPDGAESIPGSYSDDYILGQVEYDDANRTVSSIDNLGRTSRTSFDLLGRTTKTIENVTGSGVVSETDTDENRTTEYLYDAQGRLSIQRARNPKGDNGGATDDNIENQDTVYLYGLDASGLPVSYTLYPDSTSTYSIDSAGRATITGGSDHVTTTFDRLGRVLTTTDQREVEHTYSYDSAGRLSFDAVTARPSSVDGAVLGIGRTYDNLGRLETLTSYAGTNTASTVVNQVKWTYDGWGNIIKSQQAHNGAVAGDGSTPTVQYTFDDGAGAGTDAKYVRLTKVTYPTTSCEVFYNYGTAGSMDDLLSRVNNIADSSAGTTEYAQYSYLGDGTIVAVTHPAVSGGLTLSYNPAGDTSYSGWDRFGRVIDQKWTNAACTTTLDEYQYTYDRASNRLTRTNSLNSALSESYTYDGLDRLIDTDRNGSDLQSWDLDSLGNWAGFTDTGGTQTRTANASNELDSITGSGGLDWVDPVYDAAGNMTSGPKAGDETTELHYKYDAWNRLVEVKDDADPQVVIATYEYDGQNRRIEKAVAGQSTEHAYFNEGWQRIETRQGTVVDQYVFDLRYIDAAVVRFHDANGNGSFADTGDNTPYYTGDANFNVTALVNAANGQPVERYAYTPYGQATVMDDMWNELSGGVSAFENDLQYAGYVFDPETELNYARNRYQNSSTGTWINRDPAESGADLFEYVEGRPIGMTDPTGLETPNSKWERGRFLDELAIQEAKFSKYMYFKVAGLDRFFADMRATINDNYLRIQIYSGALPGTTAPGTAVRDGNHAIVRIMDGSCGIEDRRNFVMLHELIHARQIWGNWFNNDIEFEEAQTWGVAKMLGHASFLSGTEDSLVKRNFAVALRQWDNAWIYFANLQSKESISDENMRTKDNTHTFNRTDFWGINDANNDKTGRRKLGVRFSCAAIAAVYNKWLADNGIKDICFKCPANLAGSAFE